MFHAGHAANREERDICCAHAEAIRHQHMAELMRGDVLDVRRVGSAAPGVAEEPKPSVPEDDVGIEELRSGIQKTIGDSARQVRINVVEVERVDADAYHDLYERSVLDPKGFWAEQAQRIDWIEPFTKVKHTSFDLHDVSIRWYEDGTFILVRGEVFLLEPGVTLKSGTFFGEMGMMTGEPRRASATRSSAPSPGGCPSAGCRRA